MVSGDQPRSAAPAAPDDGLNRADIPLVKTWLHNRSSHTVRAYRADVAEFARFVAKPPPWHALPFTVASRWKPG